MPENEMQPEANAEAEKIAKFVDNYSRKLSSATFNIVNLEVKVDELVEAAEAKDSRIADLEANLAQAVSDLEALKEKAPKKPAGK